MMKMIGSLALAVCTLAAAPTVASAHHHDRDRGGFSFGFSFGGYDGGYYGYSGYSYPGVVVVDPGCDCCGHWEYQTQTYIVTPGYWNQVWVSDCCCSGHYENVWVPPVYGTRTVQVWVR